VIAGGLAAVWGAACHRPAGSLTVPIMTSASNAVPGGPADVEIALRAVPGEAVLDIERAGASRVWRFEGEVIAGPKDTLSSFERSYLGPTFRVRRGQRVRIHFDNALDEPSIVHWHGLNVSQENDGHPRLAVNKGSSYAYDFTVDNPAGTYWYHPHPDGRTGAQVYAGMAGMFLVVDDDDHARGLPTGDFDLPLVLQDRALDAQGELLYDHNPMIGMLGDRMFVNGNPNITQLVKAGAYRLRLLNGSNARIFKLAWSDGSPMTVIGSDGGLLAAPVLKPYVMLAPAERIELWADFGRAPAGEELALESQAFVAERGRMGMRGGASVPNGTPFQACRFSVKGRGRRLTLPTQLRALAWRPPVEVINVGQPRRFDVTMNMMRFLLNDRTFEMTGVAPDERVKLDTTEDWEFRNPGGIMAMPHPIHVHGGQFQIVERSVAAGAKEAWSTVGDGLINEGWKDTFLLMPGERVRIRLRFERHAGLFLYHCHNLEHEDLGMMRNFSIEA